MYGGTNPIADLDALAGIAGEASSPLAVRVAAQLRPRLDDDIEEAVGRLPGCQATPWPSCK